MWPYMIRVNTKALLLVSAIFAVLFIWYYLITAPNYHLIKSIQPKDSVDLKTLLIASILVAEYGGEQVIQVRYSNGLNERSKGKTKEGANDVLTKGDIRSHMVMVEGMSNAFPNLRIISEEHSSIEKQAFDYEMPLNLIESSAINNKKKEEQFSLIPDDLEVPLSELMVWIDPLDATFEYAQNLLTYVTTMVCIARNGVPIIGVIHRPFQNETYWSIVENNDYSNIKSTNKTYSLSDKIRVIISRSHAGDVERIVKKSLNNANVEIISAAGAGYKTIELIKGKADAYVHTSLIKKWDICAPNAILNAINSGKMTSLKGDSIEYYDNQVFIKDGILATISKDHYEIIKLFQNSNK